MKALNVFTVLTVFIVSCLLLTCRKTERETEDRRPAFYTRQYEGCEYFVDGYRATHSGTCPNPIHPENWTKEQWRKKLGLDRN